MKKLYALSNAKLLVVLSLIIFSYLTGKCQNTTHNLFPANGFASIAFEDLWPAKGDYDMNDIVIDCKFDQITNSENKVTQIQAQIVLRAMGASFHNGFGIQLPVTPDKVSGCVVKFDNGEAIPISGLVSIDSKGLEQGQDKAVVILFDDGFLVLPQNYPGIGVNTALINPWTETRTINMTLTFSEPIDPNLLVAPYNPFIFTNSQRGAEIHLPNCAPTSLATKNLFKTLDDDSNVSTFNNPSSIRSYLTKDNLPWAIFFYKRFDYPIEKAAIIDAYHHFAEWAQSGGSAYPDWYFNTAAGYRDDSKIYLHAPSITTPSVSTSAITNITTTTASSGGNVLSDGGSTVTARGVCWSITQNPTIANSKTSDDSGIGSYTSSITGLNTNTSYYVRAYATNGSGTTYGNQVTFSTGHNIITLSVATSGVSEISSVGARCGGFIADDGGLAVSARGVCWSTTTNPTVADSKTTDGTGTGNFSSYLTGLNSNTTYTVRAYATNSAGTVYGAPFTFTTIDGSGNGTVTDIDGNVYHTVTIGTQVWMVENLKVTKYNDGTVIPQVADNTAWQSQTTPAFCWYNNSISNKNPYGALYNWYAVNTHKLCPQGWHVPSDGEWDILTNYLGGATIAGAKLKEEGTAHWVSPNTGATNSSGFTALPAGYRVNTDPSFSSITFGTFLWSSTSYGVNAAYARYMRGLGSDANQTGMTMEMGFSVRCIKNDASSELPVLTTTAISSITSVSAVSGGTIISDGGATITERGICWNTTGDPLLTDNRTSDGTGTGSFISNISGLTANTSYFLRAYATNSYGTTYGNLINFTTPPFQMPLLVSTLPVSNILSTTATDFGNVMSDGGSAVTLKGVCWSVNTNPTTADSKTENGFGLGNYTSNLTGLTANTLYYVRAYAINSKGTAYGNQQTFTTLQNGTIPTIITFTYSNNASTTANSGGQISADGGSTIIARGICWNTSENPTIGNSKTSDGTGIGNYTSNMMGLTINTTYYVRAYATNSAGTAYGNQVVFNTPNNSPIIFNPNLNYGSVTDIDGNIYKTITIGTQTWMAENLRTTKYNDGSAIPFVADFSKMHTFSTPGFCYYSNDVTYKNIYGAYYNGYAVNTGKLCPVGWHVPSDTEWKTLIDYLGGDNVAGGKLKEVGTSHWSTPNALATNESGFTGLPGYYLNGSSFYGIGFLGFWWGSTYYPSSTNWSWRLASNNNYSNSGSSNGGDNIVKSVYPIRCIKDIVIITPTSVNTSSISNITATSATSGGNIISDGGSQVTARGVCWGINSNPTILDNKSTDGTSLGIYTSYLTGLSGNTTYYYRAYVTNSLGTFYGSQQSFTTSNTPNPTVTDIDGNIYHTITIGTQIWMVENLKVTRYNDGSNIPFITDNTSWSALTTPGYCWYNNDATTNKNIYGALYNWFTVNTGKLCPSGWHVPSDVEWQTLSNNLGGNSVAGGKLKEAGTSHWHSPNVGATNESGFTALPGSCRNSNGTFYTANYSGLYWGSNVFVNSPVSSWFCEIESSNANVYIGVFNKPTGLSVRCIKD